jgi:FkbM family methyltransferase
MSEALLAGKPPVVSAEKLLWFAGRFLHLIPAETHLRVPFGINRRRVWIRGAANAPEWLGIYEYDKQRALSRLVRPSENVCDIGANAGFYALALSRLVGENGKVFAFEPLPANLRKLRRHLDLNANDNVVVSPCALSDTTGSIAFAQGANDFTGRICDKSSGDLQVAAITLDEFVAQNAIVDPTFLKIDVEGAEARVLKGARELIGRTHPTMLIAIHGVGPARDCFSILDRADYTITTLRGRKIDNADVMPAEIIARYRRAS